jgi:hypothetical protein
MPSSAKVIFPLNTCSANGVDMDLGRWKSRKVTGSNPSGDATSIGIIYLKKACQDRRCLAPRSAPREGKCNVPLIPDFHTEPLCLVPNDELPQPPDTNASRLSVLHL